MIDSNDTERIGVAGEELKYLIAQDELRSAIVLVFANKQDLPNAMPVADLTRKLQLQDLRYHKWLVQPCCAATGEGLFEGFDWLAQNLPKH